MDTTIAAALIGFAGMILGALIQAFHKELLGLLMRVPARQALPTSPEEKLRSVRKRWFHYEYSERYPDKPYWGLTIYDFTASITPGQLSARIEWPDNLGVSKVYLIDGIVRDNRVIFLIKAESSEEPVAVEVFPFMGEVCRSVHSGFWLMHTWSGDTTLMPTIISERPLHGVTESGLVPVELADQFHEAWRNGFRQVTSRLPPTKKKRA